MTKEQALKLYQSNWWEDKIPIDLALFQLSEERLCMPFTVFHDAVEAALGRCIFDVELALNREEILRELQEKHV